MSIEGVVKLLEFFNKPFHFFIVGIFLLCWYIYFPTDSKANIFWGILFLLLAFAEYLSRVMKHCIMKRREKQKKIIILQEYEQLSNSEKKIINTCCDNNCLCYSPGIVYNYHYDNEKSLCIRGFGKMQGTQFIMDKTYFDILRPYIIKNKRSKNNKFIKINKKIKK